jgi:hypothetical protein
MSQQSRSLRIKSNTNPVICLEDAVFFPVLMDANHSVEVTIGGTSVDYKLYGYPADSSAGLYHGYAPFARNTGEVYVNVAGAAVSGPAVSDSCTNENANGNAVVLSGTGNSIDATVDISGYICVQRTGWFNFESVCSFACEYGYCPVDACIF